MITSSSKANKQSDPERNDVQSENSSLKLRLAKVENELKDKDEKLLTLEVSNLFVILKKKQLCKPLT